MPCLKNRNAGRTRQRNGVPPTCVWPVVAMAIACTSDPDGTQPDAGAVASHHVCGQPYAKDPRDDTTTGEPVRVPTGDNGTPDDPSDDPYELQLPQEILDWLMEQRWIQVHGYWHDIRRWDQGCPPGLPCRSVEQMQELGLERAPIQEGQRGDGTAFLAMHRHMLRGLREAFPKHADIFNGFEHIPQSKDDPENPLPWRDVVWNPGALESISTMENVGEHLDLFLDEDDYAKWAQFPDGFFRFFATPATVGTDSGPPTPQRPVGGMHVFLHAQWTVPGSPSSLVDNATNTKNFAFWRLHGWLDAMWERYRQARGLSEDDRAYQGVLVEQCEEMHELSHFPAPGETNGPFDSGGETGVFATQIAPVFHDRCSGSACHGARSPTLGLTLAGALPSVVLAGLMRKSAETPSLALVEPGRPEDSWLYRKLSGSFDGIDCSKGVCTQMPPAGLPPTSEQIERVRAWIAAGATAE